MRSLVAAALGARLHLGMSASGAALLHTPRAWGAEPETLAEWPLDSFCGDTARLAQLCGQVLRDGGFGGLPLSITLGDEGVRLFMVTPPRNTTRLRDLRSAAAMRFQGLYGESAADWMISGDDDLHHPFLACAIPRAKVALSKEFAATCGLRLIALVPQFVAVWNHAFRRLDGAWLGVVQGRSLTLGTLDAPDDRPPRQRRLAGVHRLPIPDDADDADWLADQVGRVALREGRPLPHQLWLVGRGAPGWLVPGACGAFAVKALELPGATPSDPLSASVLLARSGALR